MLATRETRNWLVLWSRAQSLKADRWLDSDTPIPSWKTTLCQLLSAVLATSRLWIQRNLLASRGFTPELLIRACRRGGVFKRLIFQQQTLDKRIITTDWNLFCSLSSTAMYSWCRSRHSTTNTASRAGIPKETITYEVRRLALRALFLKFRSQNYSTQTRLNLHGSPQTLCHLFSATSSNKNG